jgi:hypothetical protein
MGQEIEPSKKTSSDKPLFLKNLARRELPMVLGAILLTSFWDMVTIRGLVQIDIVVLMNLEQVHSIGSAVYVVINTNFSFMFPNLFTTFPFVEKQKKRKIYNLSNKIKTLIHRSREWTYRGVTEA